MAPIPWEQAWQRALYGPDGFFTTGAGPAAHFRTAVHAAAGTLATALRALAAQHGRTRVLDVGAGRGELLTAMASAMATGPANGPAAGPLHGVDVVPRPPGLPDAVGWSRGLDAVPGTAFDDALVVAWELLDDIPCPVLEIGQDGRPRTVLVEPATGQEVLGPDAPPAHREWCRQWWPLAGAAPGDRAEVGLPRDEVWAGLVGRAAATRHGATLLAVDYHHRRDDRPARGTLIGYRGGRATAPVPDGRSDVTAHVALDAVAAAGESAGAASTWLSDQRTALLALGVRPGPVPAAAGGAALLRALADRSAVAEVLDPGGLGGFGWLVQRVPGRNGGG